MESGYKGVKLKATPINKRKGFSAMTASFLSATSKLHLVGKTSEEIDDADIAAQMKKLGSKV